MTPFMTGFWAKTPPQDASHHQFCWGFRGERGPNVGNCSQLEPEDRQVEKYPPEIWQPDIQNCHIWKRDTFYKYQ